MKITVGKRITILVVVGVLGLVFCLGMSYRTLRKTQVGGPIYAKIILGKDLLADILPPPEYIIESELQAQRILSDTDPAARGRYLEKIAALEADFEARQKVWSQYLPQGPMRRVLLEESAAPARAYYSTVREQLAPAIAAKDEAKIKTIVSGPLRNLYEEHRTAIDRLVVMANEYTASTEADATQTIRTEVLWTSIIACSIAVISILFGILSGTKLVKTLGEVAVLLSKSAGGVAQASSQIAQTSTALAEATNKQAASLEETASALEQISAMTKQTDSSASAAAQVASAARDASAEGTKMMEQMTQAIHQIEQSAKQTANIVASIDEIAFQTNLLALNAAVEAARAGESGKGFAVVAEEVRALARRSAEAAQNTATLIEQSVKSGAAGVKICADVAGALDRISHNAAKVSQLIEEIAGGSRQQSSGINQITSAINQVDKVSQSNATGAEESASAANDLSDQAQDLRRAVTQLVVVIGSRRVLEQAGYKSH